MSTSRARERARQTGGDESLEECWDEGGVWWCRRNDFLLSKSVDRKRVNDDERDEEYEER